MIAWYPLAAWQIDRAGCADIVKRAGFDVGKSACFMCPNNKPDEWTALATEHPELYAISRDITDRATAAGNARPGSRPMPVLEDVCKHAGCFT